MRKLKYYSLIVMLNFTISIYAQDEDRCQHCNMAVKDQLHKSTAVQDQVSINFDAIECLVNYAKSNSNTEVSTFMVADYNSGNLIDAKSAVYLKTKAIPSPMGAFLSAFKSREEAEKMKAKKGGEIFSWEELQERFKHSDFGALEHNHHKHNRPDAHAPIGVMGDHLHHKGGLMVSLRYMNMTMNGNRSGTSEVNDEKIYEDFMVAPQEMGMEMYMLGLMYAPSDRLTIMAMQNYLANNMELTAQMMMMGGMKMKRNFSTSAQGIGDMRLGFLYGIFSDEKKSMHLNSQISVPVGSILERDDTPMMNDVKLPYRMQLGSGTYDYTLGATFKRNYKLVSFGTQLLGTVRTGRNTENYRLGNQLQVNIWGAYALNSNFSFSGRLQANSEGEIQGEDKELNPKMITTANTSNYGGQGLRSFIGFNLAFADESIFRKFRMGVETGIPVYENYSGIQMNEELTINVGLKYNIL